ncbi:CBASS cGAMP-activated phospholipase [Methylovirgula sp. HY1]|uniref:CBASS cGAMP-activated phospholipase n=1 Tax=Methylovirgula sp. HY1 TaxID=2822761 RepID=UPI001C5B768E|nr:CBASS cGAMP-activated phospholipase [Methylovirgula sp. HY1]QXX76132.1 hypothetical protein MHY1_02967 [Methylovirgula sp. HY1]
MNSPQIVESPRVYKILSIDGGGIRGVFPAALLAAVERHLPSPLGSYFDLIAGTSTGGIIAIGLGLGLSAATILKLYEEHGPAIFGQGYGSLEDWLRRRWHKTRHLFKPKYSSEPLRQALEGILTNRQLGESTCRLVIPAWHPVLERVYIYKTAHHPRLETDYRALAADAAMATAAAPTFLKPHVTNESVELVDGGVWANCPIAVAAVEAIGLLNWPANQIKILSIGTIDDVAVRPPLGGWPEMMLPMMRLFMAGQMHNALGMTKILTGDGHDHRAIWRIDQTAPAGRYAMDDVRRISEMKSRALAEAREQLPELRRHFFDQEVERFVPFHKL